MVVGTYSYFETGLFLCCPLHQLCAVITTALKQQLEQGCTSLRSTALVLKFENAVAMVAKTLGAPQLQPRYVVSWSEF
jgi:hypothetical protein